jgi:histone-lysine N-methyltransferase SETD2
MNTQSTTRPVFTTPVHHQGPFVLPQLRGTMSTQSSNLVQVPTLGKSLDADEKGPLPNNWKVAFDGSGNSYYYHVLTRKSQWERPTANDSEENPIEMVEMTMATPSPVTPTQDEMPNSGKLKVPRTPEESPPGTEEEDSTEKVTSTTSHTVAKDSFRHQLSKLVVHCLNKHRKPDCKSGRILNLSDFKHLARKLTHTIIDKEISRKGSYENLQFVDSVRHKTKEFVRAYMKKCGPVYKRV